MSKYPLSFLIGILLLIGSLTTTSTTSAFAPSRKVLFSSFALLSTSDETTSTMAPEVKVGDKVPDIQMTELVTGADKPVPVNLAELVKGKKVAIFGVPGAFTPGCSKSHLPSFMTAQDELKAKGVDMTLCVATNDAYVMEAWGRTSGGADAGVRFLSDGSGELTKAWGLVLDTPVMTRTKRFSLIVEDGVVTHYFSSDKQSSDTWAPNVLSAL